MSLDSQKSASETNTLKNEDELDRKIRIQINGSWVEVMVDASSLRQELVLPLNDLFENGIHYGHVHSDTLGG